MRPTPENFGVPSKSARFRPRPRREAVLPSIGGAPRESEAVRHQIIDAYKSGFVGVRAQPDHQEALYEGISAAVAALAARSDLVLGIATGKSKRGVARLLAQEGWEGHFVTIQTADDHPSKPHPSMILRAMAETGAAPHETIMIGDTTYDMEMALNAAASRVRADMALASRDSAWKAAASFDIADIDEGVAAAALNAAASFA